MSSASTTRSVPSPQSLQPSLRTVAVARAADYLELTKPRIAVFALLTVAIGYTLGSRGEWNLIPLLHALLGIGLVAAGSSALNQYIERDRDATMSRTADRPLPAGRLQPFEVWLFGMTCGIAGSVYLTVFVNLATALLSVATLLLYVCVYTPLKRRSTMCTLIGAVPGALPPVLGWTSSGASPVDIGALCLFGILFLWQFPHFLAIAWLYRDDYRSAGLNMLPAGGRPKMTGALATTYAVVLLPMSLLPSQIALAGNGYFWAALILSGGYLLYSIRFLVREAADTARGLLFASLIYLPLLLAALVWNHLHLLA